MPLPSNLASRRVGARTWTRFDGKPDAGTIILTPSVPQLRDDFGQAVLTRVPITITLDKDGKVTGKDNAPGWPVPTTDDPDLAPPGWDGASSYFTYSVQIKLKSGYAAEFDIEVPAGDGTIIDLIAATHVAPIAEVAGVLTTAERGAAGGVAPLDADGDVNDAAGDKILAGGGGGATTLDSLSDVDTAGATDGQTLLYDDATDTWGPGTVSGGGTVTSDDITDATAVGKQVLTASDAAAGRSAIGAGTSDLALGTTTGTALAGDTAIPSTPSDIGALPAAGGTVTGDLHIGDDLTIEPVTGGANISGSAGGSFNVADVVYTASLHVSDHISADEGVTVDGRDLSTDGAKLDGIAAGATAVTSPSDIGAASSAQGALADSAVQPGDLDPYALSADMAALTATDVGALPAQVGTSNVTAVAAVVVENGATAPSGLPDNWLVVEKSA